LLLAALLVAYFTLPHAPGRVFAVMLILEGISRFLLEEIRAEPVFAPFGKHLFGTMSYGMVVSVAIVLLGLTLWFLFGSRKVWTDREGGQVAPSPIPA
jgi:prolipoprotein diacylglyceryltransferase